MAPPATRYAQRDGISIAYQVFGQGPVDLVIVNGLAAHMDLIWLEPEATAMMRRLASFARVVIFDKPGTGLSDPVVGAPTLEQRRDDVLAVMDAAGVRRGVLLGHSEGGFPAALAAAGFPERVHSLVLFSTGARFAADPDPSWELQEHTARVWADIEDLALRRWGEGAFALKLAPSWAESEADRRLAAVAERASASPGMVRAIFDGVRRYDIRDVVSSLRVPTLVLHPRDEWIPVEFGRDLARRIPGARFVELPGRDHVPFAGDWRPGAAEIEAFVTGAAPRGDPERVLRTVVFTDITGSTRRAAELGDARWRALLARYDDVVRRGIERSGGQVVKSLGDGHLCAFDGAARAIRFACGACEATAELGLELKAGVHSGECDVVGGDLAGLAVHIGARIGALARPSEVLVSSTVRDLVVGSGIAFADRGRHELRDVPGTWQLYAVTEDAASDARALGSGDGAASPTPGPAETMRAVDRLAIGLSRRAPAIGRAGLRLARRAGAREPRG